MVVVVVVVRPGVLLLLLERVSVVVQVAVSVEGQHLGRLVAAEVGVGGGRRGLPDEGRRRVAGLARAEGGAAGQGASVVGAGRQDDGLDALLEERAGGGLQNEFGALNALVLVTLGGGTRDWEWFKWKAQ